jgi:glycosyltransferase involved in cell wall biosynthesis
MKFKNLLVISNSYPDKENKYVGGIFVKEQVNYLKKYFENVYVISPAAFGFEYLRKTTQKNYKIDNVYTYFPKYFNFPLFYFHLRDLWVYLEKRAIHTLLENEKIKFDLIHAHFTWPSGAVAVELKKEYKVPVLITEHTSMEFKRVIEKKDPEYIKAWKLCNNIIRVRKNDITLFDSVGIQLDKVSCIPNGYDDRKFTELDEQMCRENLNLPHDKTIILNVGNLYGEVKGHKYLIGAMAEVVKHRNDVLCIIVGSGKLKNKIEKQIRNLNLENHVKLVGAKSHDEIPLWMNAADLFLLPSLNEGNPTVMFEALGCGKPFVGTRVGGIPEIIINDKLGILVEPGDTEGLAHAILRALETEWDEEYIREYAEQFTWDNIAKQIMKVYKSVVKSEVY